MAKHCDVCNRDYADDVPACPHCAAAKKTQLAGSPTMDRTTRLAGSPTMDRTTRLADVDPADLTHTAKQSDAHEEMAGELLAASAAPGADAEVIDLSAPPTERGPAVSESTVDLGASPLDAGKHDSGVVLAETPSSDSALFVAELASDTSKVDLVGESGVNLADANVVEVSEEAVLDASVVEDEASSAVDLGSTPEIVSGEEVSATEDEEIVEAVGDSGIDLAGLSVPEPTGSKAHPGSESSVDLGSKEGVLATTPKEESAPTAMGDSDRALESLLSDSSPGKPAAEEASIHEDEAVVAGADSEGAVVSEHEADDLLASLDEMPAVEKEAASADDEVVGEAAEEEEAAAEKDEKKPAKPAKQGSRVPALIGGTFLGLLIGAGGLIGARFGGVDVPAMIGAGDDNKKAIQPVISQTKAPSFESRAALVRNGDLDEAAKAGIETIQEDKADELAARGDYRLAAYLQKSGAKIDPNAPPLQLAIADLKKAADLQNPDALYDLGLINELANKIPEARAEYAKGVKLFEKDPIQAPRFQSALDRVDAKSVKGPGAAHAPLPERSEDRAALLALLLIGLQQVQPPDPLQTPPAGQPAPPVAQPKPEEAGFDFWKAAKLARANNFADAIRAIDKARAVHDARRFTRLRKAQNPLSDPTEDIFLRCCDELKVYWQMQGRLRDGGYLTNKNTVIPAFEDLFQKAESNAATVKTIADRFIMEKIITRPADLTKGIDRVFQDKKDAEAKAADLALKLKKAADESAVLAAKLKTAEKDIKDRDDKLAAAAALERKLKADSDALAATIKKITDELAKAKLIVPGAKVDVSEAVKKAVDLAKIKDPQGMIRQLQMEIERATASLKQRWKPEEMMPLWLLLLDQNRNRNELVRQAELDVERIKADAAATAAQKGRAGVVLGLALRNTDKFGEAKTVLESARASVDKGEWLSLADSALKDSSDPAAYFAGQAQNLYDHGRMDAALAVLDRAMKVLPPKDHGRLLARRSLIELDAVRSKVKGPLPPTEPMLLAARKDAAEAVKAGVADGHYAAGRIAEELGQWDAAIGSYRNALAAHPAVDADGSRYRIALARVLLQPRDVRPGQPKPPTADKIGWRDPAPYPARTWEDMRAFALMVTLGLQGPGLPGEQPGLEEAERLADQVLNAPPGSVPFNVYAQALAIKGRWTLALRTYAEGLRPLLPREYGNGLMDLLNNHPRLKRPDSLRTPNPLEAEKHYAAGLNFYFDRDFANAEKEFLLTVENDSQDARYFYFLGLSRLAQNKREASEDLDEGAQLERLNRPSPAAVSESLERIQGPIRQRVNQVRTRPER